MTMRLSVPNQIPSWLCLSMRGAVTGSSSTTARGMRKRKAALPERNSLGSVPVTYFLVLDWT